MSTTLHYVNNKYSKQETVEGGLIEIYKIPIMYLFFFIFDNYEV